MNNATLDTTSPASRIGTPDGLTFSKILVPIDFSTQGECAIEYAKRLAISSGATLYLLHVVETLGYADQYEEVLMETNKAELRCTELLREIQGKFPEKLESYVIVKTGFPWEQIVAASEELDCDLIVMSTHGHTGLLHVLIGSTAERVTRHSTRPVLIKPRRESKH